MDYKIPNSCCTSYLYVFFVIAGRNFFTFDTFSLIFTKFIFHRFSSYRSNFCYNNRRYKSVHRFAFIVGTMVGGVMINKFQTPMWAILIIVIGVATLGGFINGFLISYFNLPPFIATLGMLMVT